MKREIRSFATGSDLEIRDSGSGKRTLTGYAIRFGQPSADMGFTEYVDPRALNRTLRESPDVLLLRDHKQELLLARTTAGNLTLTVDNGGLQFTADLLDTTTAQDAYKDIRAGLLSCMSFSFAVAPNGDKWEQDAKGNLIRTLLDIDLFEISATSFPAYNSTSVDARSIRKRLENDDCDEDDPDADCDDEDRDDLDNGETVGEDEDCDDDPDDCGDDDVRSDGLRVRQLFAAKIRNI
jgi:uncharacterized protein